MTINRNLLSGLFICFCLHLPAQEEPEATQALIPPQTAISDAAYFADNTGDNRESGETGNASWYAGKFHGRQTANGEIFDTTKLTAAHKTLPFNTLVKVTNLENNLSIVVRINDRGPFVPGRIIDLSRAAAEKIQMIAQGITRVRVETIGSAVIRDEYTIQAGSYTEKNNALNMQKQLQAEQFNAIVEVTASNMNRVLIKQLTKTEAEKARDLLAKWGVHNVLIKKEIITSSPGENIP